MSRAGLMGATTGQWQAIDKFFGEQNQASLIEDAMGLLLQDFKSNNTSNNFLQIQIQNYNTSSISKKQEMNRELQD